MNDPTQDSRFSSLKHWAGANWRRLTAGLLLLLATRLPYLLGWSPEYDQSLLAWQVVSCLLWFAFLAYLVWWLLDRDRAHREKK